MSETPIPSDTANKVRVDIFSDIACPWCFIGKRRFENGVQQFALENNASADDIEVFWHSFQLDPTLPEQFAGTEVEYLAQAKGMDPAQVSQMIEHVAAQAAEEGLEYDFANLKVANSFTALRALEHAKRAGLGSQMKEALLSAHFEKGLNTGEIETLVQIGVGVGLEAHELRATLETDTYTYEVNADTEQARQLGISGVPFFVLDGKYGISGAQPAEVFANALAQVRTESLNAS